MTRRDTRLPPFDPPPMTEDDDYIVYQGDMQALPAKRLVKRFRAAGIKAFMEQTRSIGTLGLPGNTILCNLHVARPQYVCALIVWRLRGQGIDAWRTMNRDQRRGIAETALVDGALANSDVWDPDIFPPEGLAWLQSQLGMGTGEFRKLLADARQRFERIGRRDLHLGIWVSIACLTAGAIWGWRTAFSRWQPWVPILLGVLFGGHTLIVTLPRIIGMAGASADDEPDSETDDLDDDLEMPSSFSGRSPSDPAPPEARRPKHRETVPSTPPAGADTPYPDLVRSLDAAKEHLNQGDAAAALKVLDRVAFKDIRGVHTTHPDYLRFVKICRQSLGMDTRNIDSQLAETALDWVSALKKGEEALRRGDAEESIVWFRRSIMGNPGEAGTASGEDAARRGIRAAEALLKRRRKS